MIEDISKALNQKITASLKALREIFARIRSGRAHPSVLDGVMVDYYGTLTPLNQLANISVEEGRTLSITVWEKTVVDAIEKAILKSDLGFNPQTAGMSIRVPMPLLTEDTRRQLVKQVGAESEKSKIALRNHRRDANTEIKELEKEKMISEDECKRGQAIVQKIIDSAIAEVDKMASEKEESLMEV